MSMDFNNAESNSGFDLIPNGTVAPMVFKIKPGSVGEGGWLTSSDRSQYNWISAEFVITDGPFKNRRFWQNMMVEGPSEEAVNITRSTLRGILESSRRIKPDDMSDDAKSKRVVTGYGDFSGMEFVGKIGVEKGKDGYEDKNKLLSPVPVTSKDHPANGGGSGFAPAAPSASQAPAASSGSVPAWAS